MQENNISSLDSSEVISSTIPIYCPGCQAHIGRAIEKKGKVYLDDGFMLVLIGIRNCHVCKRTFYWHGDKLRMADLVKQARLK